LKSTSEEKGYVTNCGRFAAIPYSNGQFIIIHNGTQIRCCKNITTAKNFINSEIKKIK
jgi:hypothetical protein